MASASAQGRGFKEERGNEDFRGNFDSIGTKGFGPAKVNGLSVAPLSQRHPGRRRRAEEGKRRGLQQA